MRTRTLLAVVLFAALLSGCSRARITTEIKPDGAWTRTVTLTGQQKKDGMQMGGTLEEIFALPTGSEWKSREETKGEERSLIFVRNAAAGATVKGDLSIKGEGAGKLDLVNEATVARQAPRRFEYRETLRWTGDTTGKPSTLKPDDITAIRALLPKDLATEANARGLADRAVQLAMPMIFGPGEPLLAIGLFHPDLAERRATQRIGSVLLKALEEQFGDKLTPAQRTAVARGLVQTTFNTTRPAQPDPSEGPPTKKSSGLTPLMFILKAPGKIVSSNGEIDTFSGEVYWALYPEAALLKEVTLTAVCEM
jgi:hypothetical protein